jgi:hypothetical protein
MLGEIVWKNILNSVAKAGKFSVIIDTTTDVAGLEQFSMILRFIDESGQIKEKLVSLKVVDDLVVVCLIYFIFVPSMV